MRVHGGWAGAGGCGYGVLGLLGLGVNVDGVRREHAHVHEMRDCVHVRARLRLPWAKAVRRLP